MQAIRPSRKRAGTSTNAIPQIAARRVRIDDLLCDNTPPGDLNTHCDNLIRTPGVYVDRSTGISLPIHTTYTDKFTTPPTPCSSPEPRHGEATLDRLFPTQSRIARPGNGSNYHRNEFPFPIQHDPTHIRNRRLELTIPEEPAEYDIWAPTADNELAANHPLPTPPRSSPNVSTCSSSFPPASTYELPTPTSSGLPSLCSSQLYFPLSPETPDTPRSRFNSAASTLKLILMADHLGMSTQELSELNDFANAPMSGSSKRAGRVLVRKDVKQRKRRSNKDIETNEFQDPDHRRRDCKMGDCDRHAGPDMWKEIDWSRFSDTSDDEMADVAGDYEYDEQMSAIKGYMQMAIDAEDGHISSDEAATTKGAELGTAKVLKRMRPAELCMKTSSRTVEAAIGPLGERVWP